MGEIPGVSVLAKQTTEHSQILNEGAMSFVAELCRTFRPRVDALLERRKERAKSFDAGEPPRFLEQTKDIRDRDWKVATIPSDLMDRRVEITGPVDRKMIINALNSGANVFMADIEDSNAPTFDNCVLGQKHLYDAVRRTIAFTDTARQKEYKLREDHENLAVLMVRPRGWHLKEAHVLIDGAPCPASLFDFGLYFYHNAKELVSRGTGPYFYLPKLESHLEAQLWNDVFVHAQQRLEIPVGTIRATVLIETLPAAFEMDEILYALKDHSAGLNCGRWDYIFSYLKVFRNDPSRILPDRSLVGMTQPFMAAYSKRVIQICHRRGVHAMGGMAAQIPIKNDASANEAALNKVRTDKEREAKNGHDGTWVAHPGLIPIAKQAFEDVLKGPHQLDKHIDDEITEADLIAAPTGDITEAGLRQNISVGIRYTTAWLQGQGCVPIFHLMEDAATAEISRTQLWQWIQYGASLSDGRRIDAALFKSVMTEEMRAIASDLGDSSQLNAAAALFESLVLAKELSPFLTTAAYQHIQSMA